MASRHRTNTASYNTYGSVAYAPAYEGGALRSPKERTLQPQPKVRTHERTRSLTRTKVQVREAGEISPFAVVGFLAVGVFAVLVIFSYAQFTVANSQLSSLRSELSDLQAQNVTLSAEYERVFDMERIQAAVGDTMVRPTNDQVVYLDLSQTDNVVLSEDQERSTGIRGALEGLEDIFHQVIEYFR